MECGMRLVTCRASSCPGTVPRAGAPGRPSGDRTPIIWWTFAASGCRIPGSAPKCHRSALAWDDMKTVISSLLNDLGTASPIAIVGGGTLGLYQAGARVYHHTVGSRRDLARRFNQLAAGVTVRYVEERFGTPAFARTIVLPRGLPETPEAARPRRRTVRELARILSDATATASSEPAAPVVTNAPGRAAIGVQSFRE